MANRQDPQEVEDDVGGHAPRRPRRRPIAGLLGLLLLVNLAASLYQLPLNRLVERRLCQEHYSQHEPSARNPDGSIPEELCKLNQIQQDLGWIQGAMETTWIVGGEYSPRTQNQLQLNLARFCNDNPAWLCGREVWPTCCAIPQPPSTDIYGVLGSLRRVPRTCHTDQSYSAWAYAVFPWGRLRVQLRHV